MPTKILTGKPSTCQTNSLFRGFFCAGAMLAQKATLSVRLRNSPQSI